MRLIDADEIIKWADDSVSQYGGTYSTDMLNMFGLFKHIIDNAPTVKMLGKVKSNGEIEFISPFEYEREEFEKLYAEIKELAKRPQGKWTKTGQSFVNPNKFRNFCCSNCFWELDEHIRHEPNFCPNCGAQMVGGSK